MDGTGERDTINASVGLRVANWQDALAFIAFHTEDSTGSAGGMDDLFDRIFVSSEFSDGNGIEYNPGSLTVFGNNGMEQENESITRDGPISVFVASPTATAVNIDSAVQFQTGNSGLACVPGSLSTGAELVATYPAVHHAPDGTDLPDGTLDEIVLHRDAIRTAILNALNTDGKIRLIVVPDHPATAATYSGNTNSSYSGPTLQGLYDTNGSRAGKSKIQQKNRLKVGR